MVFEKMNCTGNNWWRQLGLILLSTAAVGVAEMSDNFEPPGGNGAASSVETDSMYGTGNGWRTVPRYSYWIPPLPEPNVSNCWRKEDLIASINLCA